MRSGMVASGMCEVYQQQICATLWSERCNALAPWFRCPVAERKLLTKPAVSLKPAGPIVGDEADAKVGVGPAQLLASAQNFDLREAELSKP